VNKEQVADELSCTGVCMSEQIIKPGFLPELPLQQAGKIYHLSI
jgi:hypothetical protein